MTEVRWADDDALPFALPLTKPKTAADGTPSGDNIPAAKAFGNIVLADEGEHIRDATGASTTEPCASGDYPSLISGPVSQRPPLPDPASLSSRRDGLGHRGEVDPCLEVTAGQATWTIVRDLVNPDPTGQQAVLEVDDAGVGWLRFSRPPDPTTTCARPTPSATAASETSACACHPADPRRQISRAGRVAHPDQQSARRVRRCRPETIAHARQHAPFEFRTQHRCITPWTTRRAAPNSPVSNALSRN